jgi:anti-sigma factor RsiW
MMTCRAALSLIEPYVDGELDASQKAEIEQHLGECQSCAFIHTRLHGLGTDLRTLAPHYDAPAHLRAKVLESLRRTAEPRKAWLGFPWAPRWTAGAWAMAATALLTVSMGWNVMLLRSGKNAGGEVAQEIVASHVRSLIGDHLLDVPSTNQHNVKPWFNGKLDYSPDVKDFAAYDFTLIGGRVDYIDHRPIAALVYKRRQHVINLFVWPSNSALTAPEAVSGFNLDAWSNAGMNYCAISDLNQGELRQFADLYQK